MNKNKNWPFEDSEDIFGAVKKFEDMVRTHVYRFFDVHEFEDIIDYYLDNENFGLAAKAADYAMGMYPSSTSIQQRICEILLDKGQPVKAMDILCRLIKIEPNNPDLLILKGDALTMTGRVKDAQQAYNKAFILSDKEEQETIAFHIGISLEKAGMYNAALRYLKKAHLINPSNYAVYYDMAFCYDKIGMPDKCIEYYNLYIDEDPFSENVWYNLGIAYGTVEQYESAIQAYDYAISLNEHYSSALFNKGNLLAYLEKYEESISVYEDFILLEPYNTQAYCYMAESFENLGDNTKAMDSYRKAIAINKECADAWLGMGVIYRNLNKYKLSISHINKALSIEPDNSLYLYTLGLVYNYFLNPVKAIDALKLSLKHNPTDLETISALLEAYIKVRDKKNARATLDMFIGLDSDNELKYYMEAAYYFMFDKAEKGYIALKKGMLLHSEKKDVIFRFYPFANGDPRITKILLL